MSATVDALLPLSLLEAVRDVDTPADAAETEFVDELRNKRLGLSDTVYAQIKRFTEASRRNQRTAHGESEALARLIARRPDAETVFRAAGRRLARDAYDTIPALTRRFMRILPLLLAKPVALRRSKRIARRYWNGDVRRVGSFLLLEVQRSVTLDSAQGSVGCAFYEASFRELLSLMIGMSGAVEHVRCAARGEGTCEWRADWKAIDRRQPA
jgi:predicted hydrocarbon binding protein